MSSRILLFKQSNILLKLGMSNFFYIFFVLLVNLYFDIPDFWMLFQRYKEKLFYPEWKGRGSFPGSQRIIFDLPMQDSKQHGQGCIYLYKLHWMFPIHIQWIAFTILSVCFHIPRKERKLIRIRVRKSSLCRCQQRLTIHYSTRTRQAV